MFHSQNIVGEFKPTQDWLILAPEKEPEIAGGIYIPDNRRGFGRCPVVAAGPASGLKPGDVVIMTTPLAFRWVHFTYAIKKGLNVFMEKPVTVDGPTSKRMLGLAEEASKKNARPL